LPRLSGQLEHNKRRRRKVTRSHIDSPVWVWSCDRCGRKDVTHRFIADKWGDRCPWCVAESAGR